MKKIYVTVNSEGKITSCVEAGSVDEAYLNDQLRDTHTIVEVRPYDIEVLTKWLGGDPNYTYTTRGERVLWVLLEDDAQEMAKRKIGRRLTEDELYRVKKGLENGMQYDVELETAVELAVET